MLGPGLRRGGPGGGGHHHGFRMHKLDAAAKYLGMSQQALEKALEDKTLAQVAKDQGKSVDGLVDALLAEHKAKIAQAVKDGRLTQEDADDLTAGLEKRLTDLVNGRFPRFDRENGPRFHRFDGPRESGATRPVPLLPTY